MTHDEHRLLRHLVVAVVVKLVVLTALWWVFIRDARVDAGSDQTANHLGVAAPSTGARP